MKKEVLKRQNLKNFFAGHFFISLSGVLVSFFLPFYLKERGLTIFEIGVLFTIGLAFGSLIISLVYSRILKSIKLKAGLIVSSTFLFLQNFFIFLIPNSFGVLASNFSGVIHMNLFRVSSDVTQQHNSNKRNHRSVNSISLIIDSTAYVLGLAISVFLIAKFGFEFSFILFALLVLPALAFFNRVNDNSRFKLRKQFRKFPEISIKLKLVLFSEILYWLALASSFTLVITFLVADKFAGSIIWLAILFGGLYLSISLTTLFTYKFLDKFNLIKTSILGTFILLLSAVLIIISTNLYFVLGAFILEGIGAGIWVPSKTAFYWKLVAKENRERISGYLGGWRGFANALGPLVGGFLVVRFGILAPFYFKAILSLGVLIIYVYVLRKD